jgi:hypothetical protein
MTKTFQFQTLALLQKNGEVRNTFMEAWNDMYQYVNERLQADNMSWMELETALWIAVVEDGKESLPIMFYDARDHAIAEYGWKQPTK